MCEIVVIVLVLILVFDQFVNDRGREVFQFKRDSKSCLEMVFVSKETYNPCSYCLCAS